MINIRIDAIQVIVPVRAILEYRLAFDPTDNDMMQGAWCIDA